MTFQREFRTHMQQLRHGGQVARKVAFRSLWHAFATPSNEGVLRQAGVGILDSEESKLHPAIRELLYQVVYFTLCPVLSWC